ncbi:MAG TPA: rhomboid family intramembrane serine protease [Burkholderiaceae bacterium]|nr:rhomboid family intramembrane serine protease [Burkholderiaceae bacterium]
MAAPGYLTGWTRPALIFVAVTLGVQLMPGLSDLWRFSRPAFEAGAWWQLVTSQWVHVSMPHAVVNAAAMVLMLLAFDQLVGWRIQAVSLLGGYLGVAITIAVDPGCISYAGVSGALHGLLAGNALGVLVGPSNQARATAARKDSMSWHRVAIRALVLVVLLILAVKLWLQQATSADAPVGWLGFVTYYPAHEAGTVGGLVAALLAKVLFPLHERSTKHHADQRKSE